MTSNQIKQISQLSIVDNEIESLEKKLDEARRKRRAIINNNNINKWPTDERIDAIGQNGNTGEHY